MSPATANPHFHTLTLDGVYVRSEEGQLVFHPLPAPSAEEGAEVAAQTHAGIVRVLERHGRSLEGAGDTAPWKDGTHAVLLDPRANPKSTASRGSPPSSHRHRPRRPRRGP